MTFGIALGSNLGDRLQNLQAAVEALLRQRDPAIRLRVAAPVYETDPVDCPPGSRPFYNSVIEIEAEGLAPLALLHTLRDIEAQLGRPNAHAHHAPRTVDLDLLYADDLTMDHPDLILPHPRLHLRRFVLQPLSEVCPDLILPRQSSSISALLAQLTTPEPPLRLVSRTWIKE